MLIGGQTIHLIVHVFLLLVQVLHKECLHPEDEEGGKVGESNSNVHGAENGSLQALFLS